MPRHGHGDDAESEETGVGRAASAILLAGADGDGTEDML